MIPPNVFMYRGSSHYSSDMLRRKRKRAEEERKRKQQEKERNELIKHRKFFPIAYTEDEWQQDRCIKAISLQPCVCELVAIISDRIEQVIKDEDKRYTERIISLGYEYEIIRGKLEDDIKVLKGLGITVDGKQYRLSRLFFSRNNMGTVEKTADYFGTTFSISGGSQPVHLSSKILSSESYFVDKYRELSPERIEEDFVKTKSRMKRYQAIGKVLRFLLKTQKYLTLLEHSKVITEEHDKCENAKKNMQTFSLLKRWEIMVIKSYLEHLEQLYEISCRLNTVFNFRDKIYSKANKEIYSIAIDEIMADSLYDEIVDQVCDYISKILLNDEETLTDAYELVKGEYPIDVDDRFIYELLIEKTKEYVLKDKKPQEYTK